MRRRIIILMSVLLLVAVVCGLTMDFQSYHKATKTVGQVDDSGIIFTITTYDGKSESQPFLKCLGHTWLSVDNRTNHSVYIRGYELLPQETLTFSVWAISEHFGVIYNLEPGFIAEYGRYEGRQSVSVVIAEEKLAVISRFIEENDDWTTLNNCSKWSISLWNEVVEEEQRLKTQTLLYTPTKLQHSLEEFKELQVNREFSGAGEIFFYIGEDRTVLRLCQ